MERSTLTSGTLVGPEPAPPDAGALFERGLQERLAALDRRRRRLLGGAALALAFLLTVVGSPPLTALATLGFAALELAVAARPRPELRYFVVTAEAALLTLGLHGAAGLLASPLEVLLLPVGILWSLLVISSIPQLDPWLSLYHGGCAAAGYAALAVLYSREPTALSWTVAGPPRHFVETLLLLATGGLAGLVADALATASADAHRALREAADATELLGGYVPAEIARRLADELPANPETREVCALVFDLRAFWAHASAQDAAETCQALGRVLGAAAAAVHRNRGLVHRVQADGFVAVFFQGSADAGNALAAAFEITDAVARLQARAAVPEWKVGIGVHLGPALIGLTSVGSRRELVALGPAFGIAARVERHCRDYAAQVLATEEVWIAAGQPPNAATPVDEVRNSAAFPVRSGCTGC